jgi:hypothetical protein
VEDPLNTFEYAMVLISIIVGLGITHILSSLGAAVHRLRHHGRSLRLEINYLVWIAFIFTWLANFWWWEFRWSELVAALDVGIFSFLMLYSVALFMLTVILVPHQLSIVDDSWEYFLSIRHWFYGGLLVLNGIDLVDSLMKGPEWAMRAPYLRYWVTLTVACVIGLFTIRRSVHIGFGVIVLVWSNALTFYQLFVLGN